MNQVLRALKAVAIVIALVAVGAGAQQGTPQDEGANIHGFLVDGLTGSRMEGNVILQDTGRRTVMQTLTRGGEYRLSSIPAGHYFLHVQDGGLHVPQDYGQVTMDSPPVELVLGPGSSYELSFTLERAGKISGSLMDPQGRPVTNADVQLLVARYDSAGNRFLAAPANVPPAQTIGGTYLFSPVPPGEFYIRAMVAQTVRTYYPGVKEPELAVMVEMAREPKDIQNLDFSFTDISSFKVTGKIVYPAQKNLKELLYFYLVPRDNVLPRLVDPAQPALDFDGARESFELRNVRPGAYDLYVASMSDDVPTAEGTASVPGYSARIPVQVRDRDVVDLVAELEPGVDLNGTFKLDGAVNTAPPSFGWSRPVFIPQDGKPWPLAPGASASPNAFVQPNGTFDLIHAPTGQYRIGAIIPEGLYLSAAWLGTRNVMGQAFEIERSTAGPLVLELRSDGAKFEGTVTDVNDAPANALVVLVPPAEFRNDPGVSRTARTDSSGHFMVSGIRPGLYTAYAFPTIENNAWLNDDFMNPYRALGLQINLGKGTEIHRDLKSLPMPK